MFFLIKKRKWPHTEPGGEASLARQHRIVNSSVLSVSQWLRFKPRRHGDTELHQKPRDQFRTPLNTELDEDMTQMKLHRLLAHVQAVADLSVSQTLDAT